MHKQFLLAALQQAWLGRGICAPNPSVGAVAVLNGKIIAQAFHRGAGTPHAEQLLLSQLSPGTPGITLYVTLEPCNHWGRTPPCVEAIIAYEIKKVVFAYKDPNPVVIENNTPELLRKAGIEVVHYPLTEIESFYACYAYWTTSKKPWVTAKIAQSFDGKIAGVNRKRVTLSNEICSQFTHKNRLHADIILTTSATINNDDPLLNVRLTHKETSKPIAIIDAQGALNPQAKIFSTAKECHIYVGEDIQVSPRENCFYHYMPMQNGKLDLHAVLSHLGELGYHEAWLEAGATFFNALHQANLVQKTYVYLVPTILGTEAFPLYENSDIFKIPHKIQWLKMGNNVIASIDWQAEHTKG